MSELETRLKNLRLRLKNLAGVPDAQIGLTSYDTAKLMDDVREVLLGIDYPSVAIFKHVTYGIIKAYLRGRGIRADGKNCTIMLKKLVTKGMHQRNPSCSWYQKWCSRILEGDPENELTSGNWLRYGQTTWSGGTPRPSYPIGYVGDIIVPATPTEPLIFSTRSTKIVFQGIDDLEEFVISLWDTIHHIERTHSNREETTVPPSYAYKIIREWDQVIKETLGCTDQQGTGHESGDP